MDSVRKEQICLSDRQRVGMVATRRVVAVFGILAGFAGIEHGVGEILQGWESPDGVMIRSWPDTAAFEVLDGEPAMTLLPNLAMSGIASILVATAVSVWACRCVGRPHAGQVLIGLSLLLLLVGGGFGPPVIGVLVGISILRARKGLHKEPGPFLRGFARLWPWFLGAALWGYLSLFPGTVLLSRPAGFESPVLTSVLSLFAFAALLLALFAARMYDRTSSLW